ncbi:PREDICTED: putative F-box protein At4g10740 [Brassica oleracea var. oleracea]|uniref:putative F-box protein At4g10740 n=1 Tax=Brassica oleracea var. oleracea TaxID=109376 RepID=UPI0006A73CA4|nr:PREDICTED: putative F-box protein At4g10740 [Brassica oleracea var. oleracea]
MTTMLDLPDDLLDEIFSRVPLDSTTAVRSTSRELGESRMIVMMDHNVYLTSVVVNENASTKRLGKLTCLTHEQVKISEVFHCDGLLLFILKDDKRLVVWNPCLGETRWIEKGRHANVRAKYKYAFGYKVRKKKGESFRRYKILRFTLLTVLDSPSYETYDFGSSSWTHQGYNAFKGINEFCDRGVSLKGNPYWCAIDSWGQISRTVCFDFASVGFGGHQDLPFRVPYQFQHLVRLSCVRDEKLTLNCMAVSGDSKLQRTVVTSSTWSRGAVAPVATQIYGSRIRLMNKKCRGASSGPLTGLIRTDGGFFVEEEKKLAMVFGKDGDEKLDTVKVFGEDGYFRELDLGESSDKKCWPLVCPYVPSFVQNKPHKSYPEKR